MKYIGLLTTESYLMPKFLVFLIKLAKDIMPQKSIIKDLLGVTC